MVDSVPRDTSFFPSIPQRSRALAPEGEARLLLRISSTLLTKELWASSQTITLREIGVTLGTGRAPYSKHHNWY